MARPTPINQVRLSYLNMIPTYVKEYNGEIGTITFDNWVNHTTIWINQLHIPIYHRTRVVTMLFKGNALHSKVRIWNSWGLRIGKASNVSSERNMITQIRKQCGIAKFHSFARNPGSMLLSILVDFSTRSTTFVLGS